MEEEKTEPSFRVSVSLSRFFEDERALCYMWVAGGRRVRWLRRRLRRLFALPRNLALRSRGHLLPPDEPLALLRPDDPVEVIPLSGDWTFKKLSINSVDTLDAKGNDLQDCQVWEQERTIDVEMPYKQTDKFIDTTFGNESEITADEYSESVKDKQHSENENQKQKQLEQVKEQALALLEIYGEPKVDTMMFPAVPTEQVRPRRVRRRVRRRRPRATDETSSFSDQNLSTPPVQTELLNNPTESLPSLELQCNITSCMPPISYESTSSGSSFPLTVPPNYLVSSLAGAAIVQNIEAAPRAPRLVRPLLEDP